MPRGQENQLLREMLRGYINRKDGLGMVESAPISTADWAGQNLDIGDLDELRNVIFYNPDGSVWSPQNADGSFPYLPGYDGPVSG